MDDEPLITWKEFIAIITEKLKNQDITDEIQIESIDISFPRKSDFSEDITRVFLDIDKNTICIW